MSSKQTYLIGWINFESICLPSLEKRELQHEETTQFQNANRIFVKSVSFQGEKFKVSRWKLAKWKVSLKKGTETPLVGVGECRV